MSAGCEASRLDPGVLDRLSQHASPIHSLDARTKLLTTLAFVLAVVSVPKYAVATLLPFFAFPILTLALSGVPPRPILLRLAAVAPFAVMVGAFNPLLDTGIVLQVGGWGVSGGWLSFASIALRFLLTISALLLLVATTGIPALGRAAAQLGVPRVFVAQILGLYRYLFLTLQEARSTHLAWRLRTAHGRHPHWRIFANILGQLLLRAVARAGRVHTAMECRGFDGEFPLMSRTAFAARDWAYVAGWCAAFGVMRFAHPADIIGALMLGTP